MAWQITRNKFNRLVKCYSMCPDIAETHQSVHLNSTVATARHMILCNFESQLHRDSELPSLRILYVLTHDFLKSKMWWMKIINKMSQVPLSERTAKHVQSYMFFSLYEWEEIKWACTVFPTCETFVTLIWYFHVLWRKLLLAEVLELYAQIKIKCKPS